MAKVKIGNAFSSVGYKPFLDSDNLALQKQSAYAEPGDEVEMPDSEAERLKDLGALEGGSDESADADAEGITTPYSKAVDEPSVDKGKPGDAQFAGTPLDREIDTDPRVGDAAGTERLALSDLKVKDGSLHAEAERLGLDVDDDETASSLRSRVAEAREQQSSDES
jgi:hypothetical protein